MSSIDTETLALIRCPVTKTSLKRADDSLLESLNAMIADQKITNRLGQSVSDPVDELLVNESGEIGFAVRGGIIQLIADEAIQMPVEQTGGDANDG